MDLNGQELLAIISCVIAGCMLVKLGIDLKKDR